MSINEIVDFLQQLPDEKSRLYELNITDFVLRNDNETLVNHLLSVLNGQFDEQVRYNAFYCLNILYRRKKDFLFLDKLLRDYEKKFTRHISLDHLRALYMLESDSLYDYDAMLHNTYKDAQIFSDNGGFLHLFSDVFATIYEKGGIDDERGYIDEWYEIALDCVNKAINLEPTYAKYYCTKARILCIAKSYSEASALINKAISLELSERKDYFLRISMYQYYKMMIYTNMRLDKIEKRFMEMKTSEANDDIDYSIIPEPYNGKEPFVFISYSRQDSDELKQILRIMGKNGIKFWYDKGIPASYEFAEVIGEKIQECSSFVLLISPNSINSEFVRKELTFALERKLKPVCVFLKDTELTPGFEIQINLYEHVFYYNSTKAEFTKKIVSVIKDNLQDKEIL